MHRWFGRVISIKTSYRNGEVIEAISVNNNYEMMLISNSGILVHTKISEVSIVSRNTHRVKLINISQGEKLVGIARIIDNYK